MLLGSPPRQMGDERSGFRKKIKFFLDCRMFVGVGKSRPGLQSFKELRLHTDVAS